MRLTLLKTAFVGGLMLGLAVLSSNFTHVQSVPIQPTPTDDPDQLNYMRIRCGIVVSNSSSEARNNCQPQPDVFSPTLAGHEITWQGWVVNIRQQIGGLRSYLVGIDMDDFDTMDDWLPIGWSYEGVRRIGLVDVVLQDVPMGQAETLRSGQRVMFTGQFSRLGVDVGKFFEIDYLTSGMAVIVDHVEIFPAEASIDFSLKPSMIMTLTRPVCYLDDSNCYTYHLVVYGDGRVVYKYRRWGHTLPKIKTAQIEVDKVRELLHQFEISDYFTLQDDYAGVDSTDGQSATTSLTLGNMRKSIYHYDGDNNAPDVLTELESLIDVTANINQFAPPSSQ